MKRNWILILIILSTGLLTSCFQDSKKNNGSYRKGWTLIWEENFDESISETAWTKIPRGTLHSYRYMSDSAALYNTLNGSLVLSAISNPNEDPKLPFLTGGINRNAISSGEIRRIEVRARITPTPGVTPYVSLVPSDGTESIGIDIVEQYGTDDFIYQSISSEYTTTHGMADNPPSTTLIGVNPYDYHTFGVEKYPDSIVFIVNNLRTKKYPRIPTEIPGQFPFDDYDLELLIGLRINKDTDPELLPVNFEIDWVRYYELDEQVATVNE